MCQNHQIINSTNMTRSIYRFRTHFITFIYWYITGQTNIITNAADQTSSLPTKTTYKKFKADLSTTSMSVRILVRKIYLWLVFQV
jgi:hypothetical protein